MKKVVLSLMVIMLVMVGAIGCDSMYSEIPTTDSTKNNSDSMFVQIESTMYWRVVYHKQSKVMYVVSDGSDSQGVFTVLVNSDGTPMLYQE